MNSETSSTTGYEWKSVPDWVNLVLAAVLIVVTLLTPNEGTAFLQIWWGLSLGAILAVFALWNLAAPNPVASLLQALVGLVVFLTTWFGGAGGALMWFLWVLGLIVIFVAIWSYFSLPPSVTRR